jgi:hypothetical protein
MKEICEYCGEVIVPDPSWTRGGCTGVLTLGEDPYEAEIHDNHTEVWMCEGERGQRFMDT